MIDEYVLSVKHQQLDTSKSAWGAVNLRLGAFGINIDLKKLFGRKKAPSRE